MDECWLTDLRREVEHGAKHVVVKAENVQVYIMEERVVKDKIMSWKENGYDTEKIIIIRSLSLQIFDCCLQVGVPAASPDI